MIFFILNMLGLPYHIAILLYIFKRPCIQSPYKCLIYLKITVEINHS